MEELKPCPFCGSSGKEWHHNAPYYIGTGIYHHIVCAKCGASTGSCRTEENARKAWNRRVNDETN